MINVRLTQSTTNLGCSCKLDPGTLSEVLGSLAATKHSSLIVGPEGRDDAAIIDINADFYLVNTVDFFTPIVDDAFEYGEIAAANAISDIYAMGGRPVSAVSILGWPVDKLPVSVAGQVLAGGSATCVRAGIPLAGGHSINAAEPFFGLAVTGVVAKNLFKQNNTPQPNDWLFLTKPIGTGLITKAKRLNIAFPEESYQQTVSSMRQLNSFGAAVAEIAGVHAMTDITGFGLGGHLLEMMANVPNHIAKISVPSIPKLPSFAELYTQGQLPGLASKNWRSSNNQIKVDDQLGFSLACDPQTNGGLLIAFAPAYLPEIQKLTTSYHIPKDCLQPIGVISEKNIPEKIWLTNQQFEPKVN